MKKTNKIEQVIDDYLTKDNIREKMVKAGLSPNLEIGYKNKFYFKTLDDRFPAKRIFWQGRLNKRLIYI